MASSGKHIIRKAVFELHLASADEAFKMQGMASSFFHEKIVPMIEKILDELDIPGETIRLEKLELDLTKLGFEDPRPDALFKLENTLREQLSEIIANGKTDHSGGRSMGVKRQTSAESDEELFLHLLKTGNLPWWSGAETVVRLEELAVKVLSNPSVYFKSQLQNALQRAAVRKRIVFSLSPATIERVIVFLGVPEKSMEFTSRLISLVREKLARQGDFITAIYTHLLHSVAKNEYYDAEVLLAEVIQQKNDFDLVRDLYRESSEIESTGSAAHAAGLEKTIKRALAGLNQSFSGKVRTLFSPGDVKLYFGEAKTEVRKAEDSAEEENASEEENTGEKKQTRKLKREDKSETRANDKTGVGDKAEADDKTEVDDKTGEGYIKGESESESEDNPLRKKSNKAGNNRRKSDLKKNNSTEEPNEDISFEDTPNNTLTPKKTQNDNSQYSSHEETEYPDTSGEFHIKNAGLVILSPFLPAFFKELGLGNGNSFNDDAAAHRAVYVLQYLVTNNMDELEEHEMLLNKVLCGIDITSPLELVFTISDKEKEECAGLLQAVADNWAALKGASGESVREGFFKREGILEQQSNGWNLKVEKITIDILLDKLPWGISIIKLPWMEGAVFVNW